jgi:NTP pyrophosphatase (non-canonical NTP hydrolase)
LSFGDDTLDPSNRREGITISEIVRRAHETSRAKGWYEKEEKLLALLRRTAETPPSSGPVPSQADDDRVIARQALADGVSKLPERFMLMVSEVAEALEEHRAGRRPDEVYYVCDPDCSWSGRIAGEGRPCGICKGGAKPLGIPTELADVVIRVCDAAGRYGIDLESAIRLKLDHNARREHRHGGKVC